MSCTAASGRRARSGSTSSIASAASAWTTITLRLCATTSCISRAIRARSSATAVRAWLSRSRSSLAARASSSSVRLIRSCRTTPEAHATAAIPLTEKKSESEPLGSLPTTRATATTASAAPVRPFGVIPFIPSRPTESRTAMNEVPELVMPSLTAPSMPITATTIAGAANGNRRRASRGRVHPATTQREADPVALQVGVEQHLDQPDRRRARRR